MAIKLERPLQIVLNALSDANRTVSEMPLRSDELHTLGLGQFPIVIGGIAVVHHIDGIGRGELRLTGSLLADVFLGKITRWSDSAIKNLNPTLRLPDAAIVVVHRAEGSGTTFNFTNYLSQVSPEWKLRAGAALLVPWPTGTGAKGNEGVAQAVRRIGNSIGYVEYSQTSGLSDVLVQNRSGRFVRPEPQSFQAAAAGADWGKTSDFYLLLTDAPGENAYPIAATVFAQMHKSAAGRRTAAVLDFFRWSLASRSKTASQLGYVPLTGALIKQIESYWARAFGWRG